MTNDSAKYWFRAKRYGWGWCPPSSWQGWAVFAVWLMAMTVVAITFAGHHTVWFITSTAVLAVALIAVCWAKGEPPAWRWG